MRKRYWFLGIRLAVILALVVMSTSIAHAQLGEKFLPMLSLQKKSPTNNPGGNVVSGDTVYVSEPGFQEKRLLVLPVFIHNCLDSLQNVVRHPGEHILSFRFQMQYNNCMLKAVGVSKRGVLPQDVDILAKHFNLSWQTETEPNYKLSTTGGLSAYGDRITITGSSSLPLPRSPLSNPGITSPNCDDFDYTPFLYVVFEVIGNAQGSTCGITADQIILVRDSIRWNNYNPANVTSEMIARGFSPVQLGVFPRPIFPITFPNNYGSTIAQITRRPRIDLIPNSQVVLRDSTDDSNYELVFPMQTQFGKSDLIFRGLQITNGISGSFLRNLIVETDQPWLRIDMNDPSTRPGVGPGQRRVIIRNPVSGGGTFFNIIANPEMLPPPPSDYPTPGIYEGFVTVRSVDAQNSAVRLRVLLIVNRNPLESGLDIITEPRNTRGILMKLRSSADPLQDETYLTMGTGIGATDGVDSLFGELEAGVLPAAGNFYARFFPPSLAGFNGLVDGRGLYTTAGRVPEATNSEASIDIRNYDIETIHTYCVDFDVNDVNDYPVVLEYDLNDIPVGAQLFFKQNVAGVEQVLNMRTEGAIIGASRRAIFIVDPSVKSFCIDYLLPRVVQFPEINRGWNFISLPVDPSDPNALAVFPNSNSGALRFSQNHYAKEDEVRAGIGYFVKYSDVLDETVPGVPVSLIHEGLTKHRIRLFEGWNTVGALSVPTTVAGIQFGPFQGNPVPSLDGEIYRYLTSRGYEQTSRIIPGYGYWIKVTRTGWYRLEQREPIRSKGVAGEVVKPYRALNNLTIADNEQRGNSQLWFGFGDVDNKRYQIPPVPGEGLFDVRFDNNGFVSASLDRNGEHVVELSGMSYPVVLTVENVDATYMVTDAETSAYIGEFTAGETGAVRINNVLTKSVKLTRVPSSTIDLGEAYPNPVIDEMRFDIAVPGERYVTVGLYNSLGEKVADLFDGAITDHESVEFNTKGLNAGVYLYKMTTSYGETELRHVVIAR